MFEFRDFIPLDRCHTKIKEFNLPDYLTIMEEWIDGFIEQYVKCKQLHLVFKMGSPCSILTMMSLILSLSLYIYIYMCVCVSLSPSGERRHRLLRHCHRCTARRHISPIPLYHLSRLRAKNIYRWNQRKRFQANKRKKQKIPRKNNYRRWL